MSSIEAHTCSLVPHSSAPASGVRAVGARVVRAPHGMLTLTYSVEGDVSRMRVPPPRPVRRADGLWRHTCLEAFVAPDSGPAYLELNFSPSGEWASYAFSAYRRDMAVAEDIETPAIAVTQGEDGLTVEASVCITCLRGATAVRLALAAIVEGSSGSLSYWALEHPPGEPDFHHPRGFALKI
ncbi:MAG: DOMON-like domain-containing protein [Terriglobales bacterium]